MVNDLTAEAVIKEVKEDEILPLKKKYVPLFYKVCNYMIDYSYGRHTYMPSTCRSFVKKNIEIMSDAALMDIVDYLKERNADIPEDESTIDKIDSDNWIYMQEDLEAEFLTRRMFYKAQEKAGNMQGLKRLLDELLDLDSLYTQKDCLHMYHQLMGIKRYLISVPEDAEVKKLLKLLEDGEKAIGDKRVDFLKRKKDICTKKLGRGYIRGNDNVFYPKTVEMG